MPKQLIMAYQLRSALGETNIALSTVRRFLTAVDSTIYSFPSIEDVVKRLEKVATILQYEAELVEKRQTPTLRIGRELNEHTINLDCVKDFLQAKDADDNRVPKSVMTKEEWEDPNEPA